MQLARILHENGCQLTVADTNRKLARAAAKDFGAEMVGTDEILSSICNVFAPCAMGGVLSAETIPTLKARVVCGSANNVLNTAEDGDALHQRGILYAPDYLANAGGVIRGVEFYLQQRIDSRASIERIASRMQTVIDLSIERDRPTSRIADELAEARWKLPAGQSETTPVAKEPVTQGATQAVSSGATRNINRRGRRQNTRA
jgi:leucine dehydrogenase